MRRIFRWIPVGLIAAICLGCQTTKPQSQPGPVDYRQDQAARQTQRDIDRKETPDKSKRPLDTSAQPQQGVIDQPRR